MKYEAEYSKSKTSQCKGCFKKIDRKNVLRMVALQKARTFDGYQRKNYHPKCFFAKFSPKSQFHINGFELLRNEDKDLILENINSKKANRKNSRKREFDPSDKESQPPEKQLKSEKSSLAIKARSQNDQYQNLRDKIKTVHQDWLRKIWIENYQAVPKRKEKIIDHVTDVVLFGALEPCDEFNCKGKFVFDGNTTYRCNSIMSNHALCDNNKKCPTRRPVKIQQNLIDDYPFLKIEMDSDGRILPNLPKSKRSTRKKKSKIMMPSSSQMILKDDGVVDPSSGLQNNTHVYAEDGKSFSATMNHVNLHPKRDKNSFYKLQLLESDDQNTRKYFIYQSWGRINTKRQGNKTTPFDKLEAAKDIFFKTYEKKSGQKFFAEFQKIYGKYDLVSITNEEAKDAYKLAKSDKLSEKLQKLLKLMIDKNVMNHLLVIFNLDINKMPLGKIDKSSIIKAYNILKDIQTMINNPTRKARFIEASNRFYSLIPHNVNCEDVIDTIDLLKVKANLVRILSETKFIFELVYKDSGVNAIILDDFYGKLNAEIEPLQHSEERRIIEQYVKDTQMKIDLKIEEIYKIDQNNEGLRCVENNNILNRKLLWHGSRITNFPCILAKGLQIAPPEALVIGCTFGKGIYFSDVIANAIEYCYHSQTKYNGLILLCEVAIGEPVLCTDPENIEELPEGKDSIQGVGKMSSNAHTTLNGAVVPIGKPVKHAEIDTTLDYNEYVVKKDEQVKIKYVVWFSTPPSGPRKFQINTTLFTVN